MEAVSDGEAEGGRPGPGSGMLRAESYGVGYGHRLRHAIYRRRAVESGIDCGITRVLAIKVDVAGVTEVVMLLEIVTGKVRQGRDLNHDEQEQATYQGPVQASCYSVVIAYHHEGAS